MILIFDRTYSETVLDGSSQSPDSLPAARIADPMDIDELRLYFLYPEWASGRWAGMRPRNVRGSAPLRMKNETTVESVFSDGEYEEKTPTPIMKNDKVVGLVRYPMRRISEKDRHTGRTRRLLAWNLRQQTVAEAS